MHVCARVCTISHDACVRAGARAECVAADLRDADAATRLINDVVHAFTRIDALINSAATMRITPLDRVTPAEWDDILAVNVRAP